MLKKTTTWAGIKFPPDVISSATSLLSSGAPKGREFGSFNVKVNHKEDWDLETEAEFFAEYRKPVTSASYSVHHGDRSLWVSYTVQDDLSVSIVKVSMPTRDQVEGVCAPFHDYGDEREEEWKREHLLAYPVVFIGHGHSDDWRSLRDHLRDEQRFHTVYYEERPVAGHARLERLRTLMKESTFALLVHTAEDESADGQVRARQNVIHETGLFQGRLGFHRAVVVRERGCEEFSNLAGVDEVRYEPGRIAESFGAIVALLRQSNS